MSELNRLQVKGFLETPPLWTSEQFGIPQFEFPKNDLHTFRPKTIPSGIRLGHQMEHVFKQLVEHSTDYELLLHNLPVKRHKQTIGEIDFILKQIATQKLLHVELTYKFYLIDPKISEPIYQLVGPNKRDMFFTKMEKIKNEQFPLLHSPEGISALKTKDIDHTKIVHQACYKAQLYQPYGNTMNTIRPLNNNCIAGIWLRFDEVRKEHFKNYHFYIPYKREWVVAPHENVAWQTHFEVLMEINLRLLKANAPMVWMRKSQTEFKKFFVVWW